MKRVLGVLAGVLSSLGLFLGAAAADPPLIVAQGLPGRLPGTLPGQQQPAAPKPDPATSSASGANNLATCCDITAIDKAKSVVSARERGSGRIVEFKVADSAVLQRLQVGQAVHANFKTKQVSVDGNTMCCTITSVAAGSAVASKTPAQSLTPVPKAPESPQAQPAKPMGAPQAMLGQKLPGQPLAGAPAPARPTTAQAPLPSRASPTEPPNVPGSPAQAPVQSPGKAPGAPASRPQDPPDDDANEDDERDPPKMLRKKGEKGGGRRAAGAPIKLDKYPDAQGFLNKVAAAMTRKEMDVSLIGGEKYMVNSCFGIKVRAGNFKMKLASPNARLEGTAAKLTFRVEHISLNGISLRMRPSTNVLKPCHFGKKFSVGGSASNVRIEFRFDPIMDLKQCKFGSFGDIHTRIDIGNLNLKPLQNDLDKIAKNAFEDALNNFFKLDPLDQLIQTVDDVFEADCPGKRT